MKTAVISDIHIDVNEEYDVIGGIVEYVRENGIELLLIAGDISSYPAKTIETVEKLEELCGAKILYVPGNHDMWNKDSSYENNDEIYEMFLNDEHCLSGKVYETDESVIIGDVAWYDYSFANHEKFSHKEFEGMTYEGRTWQDSLFNTWSRNNEERCKWFLERFAKQIKENQHKGKKIVLMTHMISHEAFAVPESMNHIWSFFNAFLGSRELTKLCVENRIAYSICGHVHYRNTFTENGVTWMCRCLNYHNEWLGNKDVREQIKDAMEIVEL